METQISRFWTCTHNSGHEEQTHLIDGDQTKLHQDMFMINPSPSGFPIEVNGIKGFDTIKRGD
jgi:hypothetical protein